MTFAELLNQECRNTFRSSPLVSQARCYFSVDSYNGQRQVLTQALFGGSALRRRMCSRSGTRGSELNQSFVLAIYAPVLRDA